MIGQHYSRRTRFFLQVFAQITILALVFQLAAFDHWGGRAAPEPAEAAAHSAHCHGNSGCADGGGSATAVLEKPLMPLPPQSILEETSAVSVHHAEILIPTPDQPPRASQVI